jgi:hypothetical protein
MRAHVILLSLTAILGGAACNEGDGPGASEGEGEGEGEADCSRTNVVELHVVRDEDGVADVQTIPITKDGQEAWLALDTGSPLTFLFSDPSGPEFVDDAGGIQVGCETWEVPGYRQDAIGVEMLEGKPILGVLGIDFFENDEQHERVAAEIDYPGGQLARYFTDDAIPPIFDSAPSLPLRGRDDDRPLVDVTIDDTPLTLMFDAGSHDTIWLGVEGDDDDEVSSVQTADGATWEVFIGDGVLALPDEPARTIPVMRALDIGYIKPELDELGAQGLFGLTGMGWRRILIDFDAGAMRLGPLS